MSVEWVGWSATAIFAASYLSKNPTVLRRVQALAACLWVLYGAIIGAKPVLVANLLVAGMAVWSSLSRTGSGKLPPASPAKAAGV
jgi:hypothetical protein